MELKIDYAGLADDELRHIVAEATVELDKRRTLAETPARIAVDNAWRPFATNLYTDGTALVGNKIWVKKLPGSTEVQWLYMLQNAGTVLHRMMII